MDKATKNIKRISGQIIRTVNDKTVAVDVTTYQSHKIYKKRYRKNKIFLVHDAKNECKVGDTVRIQACRPYSKYKKFIVTSIKNKT